MAEYCLILRCFNPKKPVFCLKFLFVTMFFFVSCASIPKIVILGDPLSAEEHLQLGIAYRQLAAEQKAVYREAGQVDDQESLENRRISWNEEEKLAVAEFEKVLRKDKKNLSALVYLGEIYYKRQDYEKSSAYFRKAYRYHPGYTLLLNNLAWISILQYDFSRAEDYILRAISRKPDKLYLYLDTLLAVYYESGRFEKAETVLGRLDGMSSEYIGENDVLNHISEIRKGLESRRESTGYGSNQYLKTLFLHH